MQTSLNFQIRPGKDSIQILQATGMQLGLKVIDNWLAKGNGDPVKNTQYDYVFRVKVIPFELALNDNEKKKIEIIDFFVQNVWSYSSEGFLIENALKNNQVFNLCWKEWQTGESIDFASNRPNTLVVYCNELNWGKDEKEKKQIKSERNTANLEIDWEKITPIDKGFMFDITPRNFLVNGNNLTVSRIFWRLVFFTNLDFSKKLSEWKAAGKRFILEETHFGDKGWFSIKEGDALVINEYEDCALGDELYIEDWVEKFPNDSDWKKILSLTKIPGWELLLGEQRVKYFRRIKKEELNNFEPEIKADIQIRLQELKNNQDTEQSKPNNYPATPANSQQNNSPSDFSFSWKIVISVVLIFGFLATIAVLIIRSRRKK